MKFLTHALAVVALLALPQKAAIAALSPDREAQMDLARDMANNVLSIIQQYFIMHRFKADNPIDSFLARFKKG